MLAIRALVGPDRFELSTPRLSSVCSNQLSYGPVPAAVAHPCECAPQLGSYSQTHARTAKRSRVKEKRNGDGGEPLNALEVSEASERMSKSISRIGLRRYPIAIVLRKEVIQPQVPLRLPCYDFTPVADPTVVG